MAYFLVCCWVLIVVSALGAEALTNGELVDILENSSQDFEEYDFSASDATEYDDDDDTIYLPGDENDEVDMEYLLEKLGLFENPVSDDSQLADGSCSCSRYSCNCCVGKKFSVKVVFKKVKATVHACIKLEYLPSNRGFRLTFTVNGRRMYRNEISLKHPPALCYNIPGLGKFARVCLQLYNVDLGNRKACAKITGVLDLKIKKIKFSLKIACFRIPGLMEETDEKTDLNTDDDKISASNIAELFRMLMDEKFDINNDTE